MELKYHLEEFDKNGIVKIENLVFLKDGAKKITIEPSKISLDIDFEIKYDNKLIGTQRNLVKVYETDLKEIYDVLETFIRKPDGIMESINADKILEIWNEL